MERVYKKLFEVRIWHDFSILPETIPERAPRLYDVREWLEIVPSRVTRELLENYHLIYKTTPSGFMVICEVKEGDPTQTFIRFGQRLKMSFHLRLKDVFFGNYTNIPLNYSSGRFFYFNNLSTNIIQVGDHTLNFLSKPLPSYDPGRAYAIGELARENEMVYEVVDIPVTEAPGTVPGQDFWEQAKNTQYITEQDQLSFLSGRFQYRGPVPPPPPPDDDDSEEEERFVFFEVTNLFGERVPLGFRNADGEEVPLERAAAPHDPVANLEYTLPLRGIAEGLYKVSLEGEAVGEFYLLHAASNAPVFGVIELFHTPLADNGEDVTVSDDHAFIDQGGDTGNPVSVPTEIIYHLHFKNRMTFWRFISGDTVENSPRPRPISTQVANVTIGGRRMPNPGVLSVQREVEEVDGTTKVKFYSNIYV
ncbi:MAG: hypothetical protein H6557_34465 [Lewinellaceae bacterium]|nr:hypothetical protein [Phaeodactylibacter sp.]MCB9041747.1 hypothetical protein [Lewinellaceae bacterium]